MAVAKTQYGNYTTLTGTLLEVVEQLNADNVPKGKAQISGTAAAAVVVY